ncbi:hypothetical protein [Tolypothrix sp. VBCCA 56010]|uniref:hypothetical protein n=1 Tax=Tolypothrix sp. VBCCA 56010 TaxID=3137731 RepID=UPI003D7E3D59
MHNAPPVATTEGTSLRVRQFPIVTGTAKTGTGLTATHWLPYGTQTAIKVIHQSL